MSLTEFWRELAARPIEWKVTIALVLGIPLGAGVVAFAFALPDGLRSLARRLRSARWLRLLASLSSVALVTLNLVYWPTPAFSGLAAVGLRVREEVTPLGVILLSLLLGITPAWWLVRTVMARRDRKQSRSVAARPEGGPSRPALRDDASRGWLPLLSGNVLHAAPPEHRLHGVAGVAVD